MKENKILKTIGYIFLILFSIMFFPLAIFIFGYIIGIYKERKKNLLNVNTEIYSDNLENSGVVEI